MSRPQTFTTVEDIPLIGGSLCLDFVNTTGARASAAPRERLTRYSDLVTWSRRAGILDASAAKRLLAAARRDGDAEDAMRRVRKLREELYDLLSSFAEGRRPTADAVARLAAHWRVAQRNRQLVLGQNRLGLQTAAKEADLDSVVSQIVTAAVDLLTSERLSLMKRCAECDWLFLDTSKNRTRRWCKSTCGNRSRSRERYERVERLKRRSQRSG